MSDSAEHESPIKPPPLPSCASQHYRIEGFKGTLHWAPIVLRVTGL